MAAKPILNTPLFNDANLVSYYELENTTDNKDSNNLTNNNSVTFTAAMFNNGANFGSSNTNKDLTNSGNYGFAGGAWSMTGWVKILTEPSGASYGLISVADSGSSTILEVYYKDAAGTKSLNYERTRANTSSSDAGANVTAFGTSIFHMITGTYDGSFLNCYLDGSLIAGPVAASGTGVAGVSGFVIGDRADLASNRFASAIIDDVGVFSRALTATEISNLFTGNFTSIKTAWGIPQASIARANEIAIANVNTINGIS